MPFKAARERVLKRLALERLATHDYVDITAGHLEHAASLAEPARFLIEGMTIEAPPGVYHPHADSTSLMFIRNILALAGPVPRRVLDVGCGSGVVALFLAKRFGADALATDISADAVEATRRNALRNEIGLAVKQSDMFEAVEARGFDLIVFNTPLIDRTPTTEWDGGALCDPGGALLERFAREVGEYLAPEGLALFSLCSNSAYECLDGVGLSLRTVGVEMAGNGFWRAIIGARRG
jgi:methylase of polypeptide subunit release factors